MGEGVNGQTARAASGCDDNARACGKGDEGDAGGDASELWVRYTRLDGFLEQREDVLRDYCIAIFGD